MAQEFRRADGSLVRIGIAAIASLLLILTGCGGSSSSDGQTSGSTLGAIEAFGSIYVNGARVDVSSSSLEMDDEMEVEDLRLGMVVYVEGDFSPDGKNCIARYISYEEIVVGPITAIEMMSDQEKILTVMGQTILVEKGKVKFDDFPHLGFDSLAIGQVIEVSGHPMNGSYKATYIEKEADSLAAFLAAGEYLEVKGKVANPIGTTFQINDLTIDYTGIAPLDLHEPPGGVLTEGLWVEVEGTNLTGSTLIASKVEIEHIHFDKSWGTAEIEGYIESIDTEDKYFVVYGLTIYYGSVLEYDDGTEADLAVGQKVEVEGHFVDGILHAEEVEFEDDFIDHDFHD